MKNGARGAISCDALPFYFTMICVLGSTQGTVGYPVCNGALTYPKF